MVLTLLKYSNHHLSLFVYIIKIIKVKYSYKLVSESSKKIIKFFCERFFELDSYPTSLSAILDLPIDRLKDFTKDDVSKLNKIDIKILRDFTIIDESETEELANRIKIDVSTLNNAIIASRLISKAWNKRKVYMEKIQRKIVVVGLNFAGKTSIINQLMNGYNNRDMINLEPTIGSNIQEFESERLNLIIWDLAGQKDNLKEYLQEPEKFFIKTAVLIFVIDTQDDIRYDNAIKYLSDIIDILEFLKEFPYIMILLHKADSDIIEDPDFQIKLEYITDKITKIFLEKPNNWSFEIMPTSIYNLYLNEPEIVKTIKSVFSKDIITKEEEKSFQIDKKLQRILDINLKLMDKFVSELSEIKRILFKIAPSSDISKKSFSVPFGMVPSVSISAPKKKIKKKNTATIKIEKENKNKEMIKTPIRSSIPQRIKLTPPISKITPKKNKQIEKTRDSQIKDAREKLIIPQLPPAPPSTTPTNKQNIGGLKRQLILELKEKLIEKGLVKR